MKCFIFIDNLAQIDPIVLIFLQGIPDDIEIFSNNGNVIYKSQHIIGFILQSTRLEKKKQKQKQTK